MLHGETRSESLSFPSEKHYYLCVFCGVCPRACMPRCRCGGQSTTSGNWFSPATKGGFSLEAVTICQSVFNPHVPLELKFSVVKGTEIN